MLGVGRETCPALERDVGINSLPKDGCFSMRSVLVRS